ncbi:L,D-transpeptidase, partial [Propionicicella superfundia]|uniref:L,D-transpeptidase n=1 Tax=Propionicicella superfundia TaxID=348582 RepID=UPI000687A9A5
MRSPFVRLVAAAFVAMALTVQAGVGTAVADPAPDGTVVLTTSELTGLVGQPMSAQGTTTVTDPLAAATEVLLGGTWSTSQVTSSLAGGTFSLPLTVGQNSAGTSTWRLRVDSAAGAAYSDSFTVTRLSTTPQIVSAPATVATDTPGSVTVQVPNVGAGTRVATQFWVGGRWSTSRTATTDASGRATLSLTYGSGTPGSYSWRITSTNAYGLTSTTSARTLTRVSAAPVVVSAPSRVTTNTPGTVTGRLQQARAGQQVWTQFLVNGKWSGSQVRTVGSNGQVSIPLTYAKTIPGSYVWRLAAYRNGRWYTSGARTLTRLTANPVILSAPTTAMTGAAASVKVKIEGVGAGYRVWTQFWANGRWSTSQVRTTNASGQAELPLTYGAGTAGSYRWRVVTQRNGATFATGVRTLVRTRVYLDSRCTTGRAICVDKTARKVYWVVNGRIQKTLDARFAMPGYATPTGSYKVYRKVYLDYSRTYNNAKMPFSIYYQGGRAVHYSYGFAAQGYNGGSHGCVNLRDWAGAEWLYNQARVGDK